MTRREAIGSAAAVASVLVLPSAAHAGSEAGIPVTVRISWRAAEAHGDGARTIEAVTAAVVAAVGTAPIWVHRLA